MEDDPNINLPEDTRTNPLSTRALNEVRLNALHSFGQLSRSRQNSLSPYAGMASEIAQRYPMMVGNSLPFEETASSSRRKKRLPNASKKVEFFCLRPGATSYYPGNIDQLRKEGFGIPDCQIDQVSGKRKPIGVPSHLNADELKAFVRNLFPRVKTFNFAKGIPCKTEFQIINEDVNGVSLSRHFKRSKVYILPTTVIDEIPNQSTSPTSQTASSTPLPNHQQSATIGNQEATRSSNMVYPSVTSTPSAASSSRNDTSTSFAVSSGRSDTSNRSAAFTGRSGTATQPAAIQSNISNPVHDHESATASVTFRNNSNEPSTSATSSTTRNDMNQSTSLTTQTTSSTPLPNRQQSATIGNQEATRSSNMVYPSVTSTPSAASSSRNDTSTSFAVSSGRSDTSNRSAAFTGRSGTATQPAAIQSNISNPVHDHESATASVTFRNNSNEPSTSATSSTTRNGMIFCNEGHSYVEANGYCLVCGPRQAAEESAQIDRERQANKELQAHAQQILEEEARALAIAYERKLQEMRQEAQRHIERENQADSERIRLRFHTEEGLRQKSFGASNSIKDVMAFIRTMSGSSYHFKVTDRSTSSHFKDNSFDENAAISSVFDDGTSLYVSWMHGDFELIKESSSDSMRDNLVDEIQVSTEVSSPPNVDERQSISPGSIPLGTDPPDPLFEEYGPVVFPRPQVEVQNNEIPSSQSSMSSSPSSPRGPTPPPPEPTPADSNESTNEIVETPRPRRSIDTEYFQSILQAERQDDDYMLEPKEQIEGRMIETLTYLRSSINQDSKFQLNIQRDNLWGSFKEATDKRSFDAYLKPDVVFVDENGNGEGAIDQGGPTIELLTLLMEEAMKRQVWMWTGNKMNDRYLVLNYEELHKGTYTMLARIISLSFLHGSMRPHFIATKCARAIILGCSEPKRISLEDLFINEDRDMLGKAGNAKKKETKERILRKVPGYSLVGPPKNNTGPALQEVMRQLLHYSLVGKHAAAYDQLRFEMQRLGVLLPLTRNIRGALTLFAKHHAATAKEVIRVFMKNIHHSPSDPSRHAIEKQHLRWFKTFVDKLENGDLEVTIPDLLRAVTGMPFILENGICSDISIGFRHSEDLAIINGTGGLLPHFTTCPPPQLCLPVPCRDYSHFENRMIWGISGSLGAFLDS